MHEHICIYNSPMVKLHVQINLCCSALFTLEEDFIKNQQI